MHACMAELPSPDRVQVPSPDHETELVFQDVIARMSEGSLIAVS